MFSDLAAVEAHLNSLINYETRLPLGGRDWPKLEPTLEALGRIGLSRRLSNAIHIAGTKGKGSTATYLEALLSSRQQSLSFTSPHLVSFTERVRLNGRPLPDSIWCDGFTAIVQELSRPPHIKLTYFEMTFVFYLWAARRLGTVAHIAEAGLGGRWDATNVLDDALAILTLVDYDHMHLLGDTITKIATDKAGIIKPGARVIVSRQPEEALAVYRQAIESARGRPLYFGRDFGWEDGSGGRFTYYDAETKVDSLSLANPGLHQRDNAATAIRAARLLVPGMGHDDLRNRLAECVIPGRQQLLPGEPDILLDVAHNPASFAALADTLRTVYAGKRVLAVTGLMKDKDIDACYRHLRGVVTEILTVSIDSPRAHAAADLAERLRTMGFSATAVPECAEAFGMLHTTGSHELGVVTGSFYLAGDYLKWRQRA